MSNISKVISNSKKTLFVGLAGPGTGKTSMFRSLIDSEEFKDNKILILTFINKLVDDLKEDFSGDSNVEVLTLHAFAYQLLRTLDPGKKLELSQYLDEIISEDYEIINGVDINYKAKFYDLDLLDEEIKFYKERQYFYANETEEVHSFNSIIFALIKIFSEKETTIPEYDLILIDELQDFNELELELISLLNKENKVVAVGDDHQSLYFFKNAKPEKIRYLYRHEDSEPFSLDYCYRCTKVIVDAANSLIERAVNKGFLEDWESKKFLYPANNKEHEEKHCLSEAYSSITFVPKVSGEKLLYELEHRIKSDIEGQDKDKRRVLILIPSYLKKTIYEGLIRRGFNVVGFKLFSDEKSNNVLHSDLVDSFNRLSKRKTDNLALRRILFLYKDTIDIKELITKTHKQGKKIWWILNSKTKERIEKDIEIYNKTKNGKKLNNQELLRFKKIFNINKFLKKLIEGFYAVERNAIEVEITTTLSSKGLSAEYVYYVGIDDENMLDRETNDLTDNKICEFLVGITRAKNKLTLFSRKDEDPKILELVSKKFVEKAN